jgi:bla regulator protein BlaR1
MMNAIGETAIAISDSLALSLVLKATVITALALISARMARNNCASVRHLLLITVFIVLLALPFGALLVPSIPIVVASVQPTAASMPRAQVPDAVAANTVNAAVAESQTVSRQRSVPVSTLMLSLWAAGVIVFLLPITAGLWQLRRIRRFGVPWLHGQTVVRELADRVGIKRQIDVVLHDDVVGPMTCRILHPAIVCPADVQLWTDAELERAMLHELEHVRRADCFTHGLARLVCAVYWFHPLVWMSWRRLGLEAERACDDAVLRRAEATEYADQLVRLARRIKANARRPLLAMANRSDLTVRIASVLDAKQRRGRPRAAFTAAAITAAALLIAAIAPLRAVSTISQAPAQPRLEFEVASVKKNLSGNQGGSFGARPGGQIVVTNNTLRNIIRNVWNVQDFQIVGGPEWINQDRWDVNAKAPESLIQQQPQQQQTMQQQQQQLLMMMRTMLADRFQLLVHNEKREMPVYAIVLARPDGRFGPQLKRSELDCNALAEAIKRGEATPPPRSPDRPFCGTRTGAGTIMTSGVQMADFARNLAPSTGRIVLDRTGLTGPFDIELKFTPDPLGPGVGDPATDVPSLFVAIQEQLGLKLEAVRAPVDVLVIDSAQRPTEN